MNENGNILSIKGGKKDWYAQVIFIPKDNIPKEKQPINLVAEAEKIIQSYIVNGSKKINTALNNRDKKMITQSLRKPTKGDRTLDVILNICLIFSIVLLVMAIYHFFT